MTVIDDDSDLGQYLKKVFSKKGFKVQTYLSIKDVLKDRRFNILNSVIILLDMQLPFLDGDKIFKLLKSTPLTNQIPIMVITSNSGMDQAKKLITYGLNGIVKKPLNMNDLLRKMLNNIPTC